MRKHALKCIKANPQCRTSTEILETVLFARQGSYKYHRFKRLMSLSCPFESRNQGNENKVQRKYLELHSCVTVINTNVWLYQRFVCLFNNNLLTRCIAATYMACGHLNTEMYFFNKNIIVGTVLPEVFPFCSSLNV